MGNQQAIEWRLALAQEISEKLRRYAGVRAIVVAGSVARGYADEYSDLELPIFWEHAPTQATRLEIVAGLGAQFLYPFDSTGPEDDILIYGFQVDIWHNTVEYEEQVFEQVLRDFSLDPGDNNFMDTVRTCIPLYGEELIAAWKEKARQYPDELARRQIEQALDRMQSTHLVLLARRNNPTLLYGNISLLQRQMFQMLLALNRRYFPTYKWMFPVLEELPVKPAGAVRRFREAYAGEPEVAALDTLQLMEETLQLVEAQFSGLNTERTRRRVQVARRSHVEAVRLSGEEPQEMMSEKRRMLDLLKEEFGRWEALLAGLSEAQITERRLPANLSVKDTVAHLWAWQQISIARLEAAVQEREPVYASWPEGLDPDSEDDLETINAWIHASNQEKPWLQVYRDWRNDFLHFVELVEAVPEADLLAPGRYAWLRGYPLSAVVMGLYEHHHEDHLEPLLGYME